MYDKKISFFTNKNSDSVILNWVKKKVDSMQIQLKDVLNKTLHFKI